VSPVVADNVSSLLPSPLRGVNQPIISTPNVFSALCFTRLACS
jgi:hypothetical protein